MKILILTKKILILVSVILAILATQSSLNGSDFDKSECAARRTKFMEKIPDGAAIILGAGPDYNYYHADISTTFPANGRFSPEQKKIYELAYGIRKTCLGSYKPGISFKDVGERVKQFLIKQGYDPKNRKFRGLIRYGGYNHSIGMATHDPMGTFSGPEEVLRPGFVFACDINLPYPDQEMGIRLEDIVVITENGYENISKGLPRTLDEIEALMKKK